MATSTLAPLRRRDLRNLIGAQFLAESADGIVFVALPLYIYAETDSELALAWSATASLVVGSFLGVIGGVFADRYDRARTLRISMLVRAALLVVAWLAPPLAITMVFGIAARALGQLDNPSFDALVPAQADGDLQQVLALRRFIQSVSIVIGPAFGALLVWGLGEKHTLAFAAALFVLAMAVHVTLRHIDADHTDRHAEHVGSSFLDLAKGMSIVVTTPLVRRLVTYWFVQCAAIGVAMAAALVWFERTLDVPEYWYGIALAGYGLGAASATLVFGGVTFRMGLARILLLASPVYAAMCALCVIAHVPWLLPLGWLLWGVALGPEIVRAEPAFVERIDEASLGRAYAGMNAALTAGTAVGYFVAGPLLGALSPRQVTFVVAGVLAMSGLFWLGPAIRGRERARPAPWRDADVSDGEFVAERTGLM